MSETNGPMPLNFPTWMRDIEKRLQRQERRLGGMSSATVMGDGENVRMTDDVVGGPVALTPPSESPSIAVTPMATGFMVVATNVAPSTLIAYRVNGETVRSTRSTAEYLTTLASGDPMVESIVYAIDVVAYNDAGSAEPSAPFNGQLDPSVDPAFVRAIIEAGFILAGTIQVGNITIRPGSDTDPGGITIPLADGGEINFPADGSPAVITAALYANSLEVRGNLRILGDTNDVEGGLYLSTGVKPPTIAPEVSTTVTDPLARTALPFVPQYSGPLVASYIRGVTQISGKWWVLHAGADDPVRRYDANGVEEARFTPPGMVNRPTGMTYLGSNFYLLDTIGGVVNVYNSTFTTLLATLSPDTEPWVIGSGFNFDVIGNDGTNLLLGWRYTPGPPTFGNSEMRMASIDPATGGRNWYVTLDANMQAGRSVSGVYRGSADFGATRTIVTYYGSSATTGYYAYTHASSNGATVTRDVPKDWLRRDTGYDGGLFWDGTRFHGVGVSQIVHFGSNTTTTSRNFTTTWYKTGSGEETPDGPITAFTAPIRSWTRVNAGTAQAPADSARVYINDHRQADLGAGVTSAVYDSAFNLAGAASPATNAGFDAIASPGFVASRALSGSDPVSIMRGDGSADIGDFHMLATGTRHYARISTNTAHTVTSGGASTAVLYEVDDFDSVSTFTDNANDRLVIPVAGLYIVDAMLSWSDTATTGVRDFYIDVNGTQVKWDRKGASGATGTTSTVVFVGRFAAGDLITARKFQNSGSTLTLPVATLAAFAL